MEKLRTSPSGKELPKSKQKKSKTQKTKQKC